jgi:hypothetical protein
MLHFVGRDGRREGSGRWRNSRARDNKQVSLRSFHTTVLCTLWYLILIVEYPDLFVAIALGVICAPNWSLMLPMVIGTVASSLFFTGRTSPGSCISTECMYFLFVGTHTLHCLHRIATRTACNQNFILWCTCTKDILTILTLAMFLSPLLSPWSYRYLSSTIIAALKLPFSHHCCRLGTTFQSP